VRVVLSPLCSSTHAKTVFNTRSNAFPVVAHKSSHFSTALDTYDNTSALRLMPLPQYNQVLPDDFHIQTLFVGKPRVACSLAKTKVLMQYSPLLQRVLQCVLQCNSRIAYSLAKTKMFMQCSPLLQHVLQFMLQYVLYCKPCVACFLAKTKVYMQCSLLLQFVLNPPLPPCFFFPFSGVLVCAISLGILFHLSTVSLPWSLCLFLECTPGEHTGRTNQLLELRRLQSIAPHTATQYNTHCSTHTKCTNLLPGSQRLQLTAHIATHCDAHCNTHTGCKSLLLGL